MTKLIIKTDEEISVLYLEYEKNICNYYGFKVCDKKIMPLPEDAIKILDIFKLSVNRKPLGIEDGYDVILDCDTNFKHYFKNNNEDFDKFILMNSEDLTVYEDDKIIKKNNNGRFRKFVVGFVKYAIIVDTIAFMAFLATNISKINSYKYSYDKEIAESFAYPFENSQKDNIINYIKNSSNLNEQEKDLLINDDYLNFISPYLSEVSFTIYLNDRLDELDIAYYDDVINPRPGTNGYYKCDNILYIKYYNENNPMEKKGIIGHEFNHLFSNPFCSSYIEEAMATILTNEFFEPSTNGYDEEVTNIKGLMEIIGPEPLINCIYSGNLTEIKNLVKDYLDENEFNDFVRIISSNIHSKSSVDRNKDNKLLLALIYKMYENKYGELDHDFVSVIKNTTTVRYYFNSKFINEENSYYIERERGKEPLDLKAANDLGVLRCYYTKKVSLEEYNMLSEEEKENLILRRPIYAWNDNINYDNKVISYDMVSFRDETKGTLYVSIEDALDSNLITISGYEIRYEVSYEESLNPEIKDDCQYLCCNGGFIEDNMLYNYELRIKHFVEPIDKKFPKEKQTKNF